MDAAEFRRRGREMVDYVADYLETISSRRVLPEVKPGYLSALLPDRAPAKPEPWTSIMDDVNRAIMPGVCNIPPLYLHARKVVKLLNQSINQSINHFIRSQMYSSESEYCDKRICWCVCLSVRDHISRSTRPIFINFENLYFTRMNRLIS